MFQVAMVISDPSVSGCFFAAASAAATAPPCLAQACAIATCLTWFLAIAVVSVLRAGAMNRRVSAAVRSAVRARLERKSSACCAGVLVLRVAGVVAGAVLCPGGAVGNRAGGGAPGALRGAAAVGGIEAESVAANNKPKSKFGCRRRLRLCDFG